MQKARPKKSRYISYLFRFVIAVSALYLTFGGEDLGKIVHLLLGLNWLVFAIFVGLWVFSQVVFVGRWSVLMRVLLVNIPFATAFRLHLLGIFYNNCLPTSVGGDLLRAWYVTTHTHKKLEAALSVLVDRIIGLIGMLIMAFCCYWFIPVGSQPQHLKLSVNFNWLPLAHQYKWLFIVAVVVLALSLLGFAAHPKGRQLLRKGGQAFGKRGLLLWGKIRQAINVYCRHIWALALAMGLTFASQGIFILGLWLVGRELGVGAHIKYYFVAFPVAWIVGTLPVSIGALGIWEGTLKLMFSSVAAGNSEQVAALALGHRIIWLLGSLPGVVIHLVGAHLPKDFFIDSHQGPD